MQWTFGHPISVTVSALWDYPTLCLQLLVSILSLMVNTFQWDTWPVFGLSHLPQAFSVLALLL